jgi:transcriptional regulator with XRE-family HTH domain
MLRLYVDLGRRIKALRKKRGVSQIRLAAAVNTSPGNLSRIESGNHTPNAKTIAAIADYLVVSTDYLLGRTLLEDEPEKEVRELLDLAIETGYAGGFKEFLLWLQETRIKYTDKTGHIADLIPRERLQRGGLTRRDIVKLVNGVDPVLIKKIANLNPPQRDWLMGMVRELLGAIETKPVKVFEPPPELNTQDNVPKDDKQREREGGIDGDLMDALINRTPDEE